MPPLAHRHLLHPSDRIETPGSQVWDEGFPDPAKGAAAVFLAPDVYVFRVSQTGGVDMIQPHGKEWYALRGDQPPVSILFSECEITIRFNLSGISLVRCYFRHELGRTQTQAGKQCDTVFNKISSANRPAWGVTFVFHGNSSQCDMIREEYKFHLFFRIFKREWDNCQKKHRINTDRQDLPSPAWLLRFPPSHFPSGVQGRHSLAKKNQSETRKPREL